MLILNEWFYEFIISNGIVYYENKDIIKYYYQTLQHWKSINKY